jgi:hypothetical protein
VDAIFHFHRTCQNFQQVRWCHAEKEPPAVMPVALYISHLPKPRKKLPEILKASTPLGFGVSGSFSMELSAG